jgi:hypothetical protein
MYHFRGLVLLAILLVLAACTSNSTPTTDLEPQASFWAPVGTFLSGSGVNGSDADGADTALDSNGFPVVAWRESNGSVYNIYVKRWDGNTWQFVGGAISAVGGMTDSFKPSLALDASGNPVVAFQEDDGSVNNIYVFRFSAGSWQAVGGALSAVAGGTGAYEPSLALDSVGNPVVAWREENAITSNVFVWRFVSGAWQAVGGALSAVTGATNALEPSLALDGTGNPIVAWHESNGNDTNIYTYRYSGTWQNVGGALSASSIDGSNALSPSLDLDSSFNPVIAWKESSGIGTPDDVYVSRLVAGTWQSVGGALSAVTGLTNVGNPSLALDSLNKPVVTWDETAGASNNIYVRRWSGTVWQGVGGKLSAVGNNTDAFEPALTLDSSGNPIVAWSENNGNVFNIYVQRYFKNVWIDAGTSLDINLAEDALAPALAISSTNQPFAVWQENAAGSAYNIYTKTWNGTTWNPLGSALDRTLSNNAVEPAIAIGNLTPYVAWGEFNGSEFHNVYVSSWDGTNWVALSGTLDNQIGSDASYPSIAFGSSGLFVAWQECASLAPWETCADHNIIVKKWDSVNSSWLSVGTILDTVSANDATQPSLAIDTNGQPVMAFQEANPVSHSTDVIVKRWDGVSTWDSLGSVDVSPVQNASVPSVAIDNTNRPVVVWREKIGPTNVLNYNVYVKRWNGSSWDRLGATLNTSSPRYSDSPSLKITSAGVPIVTFSELISPNSFNIYVKQWNGAGWSLFGGALDTSLANNALHPALALTLQNKPFVAWQECASASPCSTPSSIYVKQF